MIAALAAFRQILRERFVDLDLVERKHGELAERRVSGAEVVQHDGDAEILELAKRRQTFGGGLDERRLGYFKLQPFRRQSELGEGVHDDVGQIGLVKLNERQIDSRRNIVRPGRSRRTCVMQHPLAELSDQPGFLGERNESVGQDQALGWVPPADQSLRAAHPSRFGVDDGLIMQFQLVLQDGAAQLVFDLLARACDLAHFAIEEAIAIAARRFRAIERQIRHLQKVAGAGVMLGSERYSDARADVDLAALDLERLAQRRNDAIGQRARRLTLGDLAGLNDGELVAAKPGQHVRLPQQLLQAGCHLRQQRIAGRMAERVVDLLEAIEVQQQDAERLAALALPGGGLFERCVRAARFASPVNGS